MPISKTRYIRTPTGIIRYDNNFDDDQVHMLELSLQIISNTSLNSLKFWIFW